MTLQKLSETINGKVLTEGLDSNADFEMAFSSDLMSDVLTLKHNNIVLITGLVTLQTVRTAEMANIGCIVFVRNKNISSEVIDLAGELGIGVIKCKYSMFRTSGLLYNAGLKPVF